jgi:hypothetical protein
MNYAERADLLASVLSRCQRQPNGCLDWLGATNSRGYGCIRVDGEMWLVHRLMWELVRGPIPAGLHCLHSCDRPPCVEIIHLEVGTNRENMAQRNAKGRQARGSAIGIAKLTPFRVWQVRKIISLGRFSNREIADMFGVSAGAIGHIRNRSDWTWLRDNPYVPIADLIPPLTFRRRI